jgi:hypothetical protein
MQVTAAKRPPTEHHRQQAHKAEPLAARSPRMMNMNLCQYHHFDLCLRDQNSCANAFNVALTDLLAIIAAS